MRNERGVTLVEMVVVLGVALGLAAVTVAYSMPWMVKESVRSAVFDVNGIMQLARVEAVSRNQPTRFVIDTAAAEAQVWDSRGTTSTSDDLLLHRRRLPTHVIFARPDVGSAVTLDVIAAARYQAVFTPDGMLSSGGGDIYLHGGEAFGKVTVYAAGGIEIFHWKGTEWASGF